MKIFLICLAAFSFSSFAAEFITLSEAQTIAESHLHTKYAGGSDPETAGEYDWMSSLVDEMYFVEEKRVYFIQEDYSLGWFRSTGEITVTCAGEASSDVWGWDDN